MKKWRVSFGVLFFVFAALFAVGCSSDDNETIIFQNRSGLNGVNCYIDYDYKGTVNDGQDLTVSGHYEGDHFISASLTITVWNGQTVNLSDGGSFTYVMAAP